MNSDKITFRRCPCGQPCGEVWARCNSCGEGDYILVRDRTAFREGHKECKWPVTTKISGSP